MYKQNNNNVKNNVIDETKKIDKVLRLYLEGLDYKTIAKEVYGTDDAKAYRRVARLIHYIRHNKLGLTGKYLIDEAQIITPQAKSTPLGNILTKRDIINAKKVNRQLVEHEQLIYHIIKKLGFSVDFSKAIYAEVLAYHVKIFPIISQFFKMKCWRNGKGKPLFSFTFPSLVYAISLVDAVLASRGINKMRELENIARELLPEKKRPLIYTFLSEWNAVAGQVYTLIRYPQL